MKILFIGDIVGTQGTEFLQNNIRTIKEKYSPDVIIANGENSAKGNGITPHSAESLFNAGVDIITTGNHAFRREEIYEYFDTHPSLIRPANCENTQIGNGYVSYDMGKTSLCVINLMGNVYIPNTKNPFDYISSLLPQIKEKIIIIDFHAETTSEKRSMLFYLNGKVTAIIGTHTHVQTADEEITTNGTAYITDVGMTGPINSVLGIHPHQAIKKLTSIEPVKFSNPDGPCMLNALLIEADTSTGKATNIQRISFR